MTYYKRPQFPLGFDEREALKELKRLMAEEGRQITINGCSESFQDGGMAFTVVLGPPRDREEKK